MSNNGDTPAMPVMDEYPEHGQHYGLTKREKFAMAAMQGFCGDGGTQVVNIPKMAVEMADALLAELEK